MMPQPGTGGQGRWDPGVRAAAEQLGGHGALRRGALVHRHRPLGADDAVDQADGHHVVARLPGLLLVDRGRGARRPQRPRQHPSDGGDEPHRATGRPSDGGGSPAPRRAQRALRPRRLGLEQHDIGHRGGGPDPLGGHVEDLDVDPSEQPAHVDAGAVIRGEHLQVAPAGQGRHDRRGPAHDQHPGLVGQGGGQHPGGGVALDLGGAGPPLGLRVGGHQHPAAHPPHRSHRRVAGDELAGRGDQAGGIVGEGHQRVGRLGHQLDRVGAPGPGDVAQPLDRVHSG